MAKKKEIVVGFTGTRDGTTDQQRMTLWTFIMEHIDLVEVHHGLDMGADLDFHNIVLPFDSIRIVGHPPINTRRTAHFPRSHFDFIHPPKDYLDRNRDIVDASSHVIACPATFDEQLRSGTWATVRYARKCHKPLAIIWPDGKVEQQ